ncbi:MAG: DNA repair protein RecO [Dehalococcoidia bacterium]|nr:DNA repair protein RecO [Dehalococcoidia bacterium]
MPGSRSYSTEAIVLRQRRLGDADKIITLFTPDYGRIEAVAKGVRRSKSRLAGHVEVLSHCNLLLHRGRSLDVITQAQLIGGYRSLREDLSLVSRGLYAAELVERFTDVSADSLPTFRLLVDVLQWMTARTAPPDVVLRYFEMRLLDELGYRPQVDCCVACGGALPPETNYYSAHAGGVACPSCRAGVQISGPLGVNALKVLRLMQRASFEDLARVGIEPALQLELERHLREHINFSLDREVRSAAFVRDVQRQEERLLLAADGVQG